MPLVHNTALTDDLLSHRRFTTVIVSRNNRREIGSLVSVEMPSNIHRRPRGPATHPDSKRWDTTLSADLNKVAKQLEGSEYYDTGKRTQTLRNRKLANTQTSISFGNHKVSVWFQL